MTSTSSVRVTCESSGSMSFPHSSIARSMPVCGVIHDRVLQTNESR